MCISINKKYKFYCQYYTCTWCITCREPRDSAIFKCINVWFKWRSYSSMYHNWWLPSNPQHEPCEEQSSHSQQSLQWHHLHYKWRTPQKSIWILQLHSEQHSWNIIKGNSTPAQRCILLTQLLLSVIWLGSNQAIKIVLLKLLLQLMN